MSTGPGNARYGDIADRLAAASVRGASGSARWGCGSGEPKRQEQLPAARCKSNATDLPDQFAAT